MRDAPAGDPRPLDEIADIGAPVAAVVLVGPRRVVAAGNLQEDDDQQDRAEEQGQFRDAAQVQPDDEAVPRPVHLRCY
jgi:hypothetical protein